jgi:peptidoglycan/LPS O-acetylase OafA/YrhL/4-amino-4-deoxy-L-arabinose transferase-like glycosyltransferase
MTTTATTTQTSESPPGGTAGDGEQPGLDAAPVAEGAPGLGRPRRFWWWLAAIVAVGLAVRLGYLLGWRTPWTAIGDPYYYHHGANLLADGEGYVHPYQLLLFGIRHPGADHPPGFMTVLAGFSWLGLRSFFQHQVIACVLGGAGVAAMGAAGRRIAGERVGLIVAGLAALSPNLFYFDAMVVSESLVIATTAAILVAAYRWWDQPTTGNAVVFGVVIGVAALVRSEAILLGPLIAVPLVWWRHRPVGRRLLVQLGGAGAAAVVVVAPWVGYNLARFSEPVTLSAQFDQTLGTANCESVYFGDRVGYWSLACIQETEHLVPEGDASAQGKGFREIAIRYARDNADRVPFVVAGRIGRTFGLYQPQEQIELDTSVETKEPVLGEIGMVAWYVIAVAGGLGLVGLRRAGRPIFPLVAVVASVVVVVAVIYGNTRFRLPAELALMIPAAVTVDAGFVAAGRRWRTWRERGATTALQPAGPGPSSPGPDRPDDPDGSDRPDRLGPDRPDDTDGSDRPEDPDGSDRPDSPDGPGTVDSPNGADDVPGGLGSSTGRYAGFDGVRALAALGVLVTHVALKVGFSVNDARGHYYARLDVGVAIFFVLSGFLLYRPFVARRLDGRARPDTRNYLRNRFLRIYPGYWLALTVLVVALDTRARDEIQSLWDLVMYYGLFQSYSADTALGGLQQAWTLTNEVAFYLLLPLWAAGAAWLARRLRPERAVRAEVMALAAAAAGALAFRYWVQTVDTSDVTLGTIDPRVHWLPANFHMFVPGMALALATEWARHRRPATLVRVLDGLRRHPLACWAAAAACFWMVSTQLGLGFEVGASAPRTSIAKELLYAGVGFFVVLPVALAGASLPRSLRWLGSRPMVTLGVLSYGIYLWHEGVFEIYRTMADVEVFQGSLPPALVVTVVGSVVAAGLSYVLVERPALSFKDRRRRMFATWRPVGLPAGATP